MSTGWLAQSFDVLLTWLKMLEVGQLDLAIGELLVRCSLCVSLFEAVRCG